MATFIIDTSTQRITAKALEITSEQDFIDFVNGLFGAAAIFGWEYPDDETEEDDDGPT